MHTDFAKSPLITPQRLKSEKTADLFRVKPEWDRYIGLVRPDEDLIAEEAVFHSAVAGSNGAYADAFFAAPFVAILYELTRYPGISVRANIRESGDPRQYIKLIFASAPKDNMPVARLVTDASAGEQTEFIENRHDHRSSNIQIMPGRSKKDARETALRHAEEAARSAGLTNAEVTAYISNLLELFAFHDECEGVNA